MYRSKLRAIVAALGLPAAVAGMAVAASADPVTLQVEVSGQYPAAMIQVMNEVAAKHNFKLKINVLSGGWPGMYQHLAQYVTTDVPFDVAVVQLDAPIWGLKGVFADLTPFIKQDSAAFAQMNPSAMDAYSVGGHQYALPAQYFAVVQAVNKDMFNSGGVALPAQDWDSSGWSWNDFLQAAQKLTISGSGSTPTQWGFAGSAEFTYIAQWAWGAHYVTDNATKSGLADPALQAAVQRMADMRTVQHVWAQPGEQGDNFALGKAAIGVLATWGLPGAETNWKFNWAIAPFFRGTQRAAFFSVDGIAMSANSSHKQQAWELLKALTTDPATASQYALSRGALPPDQAAAGTALNQMQSIYPKVSLSALLGAFTYAQHYAFHKNGSFRQILALINQMVNDVSSGKSAAKQELESKDAQMTALLKDGALVH